MAHDLDPVAGGQVVPPQAPARSRDRRRDYVLLERAVAALHEEHRPNEALRTVVRMIAEHDGWRMGYVYRARGRPPVASPTTIWYDDQADGDPSRRQAVHELHRTSGRELATRVLRSHEPLWLDDAASDPALGVLRRHGLGVLAMFPVTTSRRPVAVLEFLAGPLERPDDEFLLFMRVIGLQLGYVIERAALERRIARLAVEEQQRIARELHDTVGQEAAAIGILTRLLHRDLERHSAAEAELAGRLLDDVQRLKVRVRDFVSDLRPIEIDPRELRPKLEELAQRYARLGSCACTVDVDDAIAIDSAFAATKIARIAREAVHNAVKHGDPSQVSISLRQRDEESVELAIVNDGKDADPRALTTGGHGVQIMRHRADVLEADLRIEGVPGGGVQVRCVIPIDSLRPDEDEETAT